MELKTGYEWCRMEKVRPLLLQKWQSDSPFPMKTFYTEKISIIDFFDKIKLCIPKPNTMPIKGKMFLEYRMYGFVPYNLSEIQKGIQFGHAVVEYGQLVKGSNDEPVYNKFAKDDKTFIILNGGTTNENPDRFGSMQNNLELLKSQEITHAEFREPDLNDTLTAIVFLVDESVFNRTLYPDFFVNDFVSSEENMNRYNEWVEEIGGLKNIFLRNFLDPKKTKLA
jgi:hypothetical protein